MDDMGTPGPNHPAHRGLKAPDNVIKLPGMHLRRARLFKNNMLDAVLGPEQVEYKNEPEESHLDNYVKTSIENSGQADALNAELGRTSHFEVGQQEAKIHHINEGREIKRRKEFGNE